MDASISDDSAVVALHAGLKAQRIADDMAWGQGAIQPLAEYATPAAQKALLEAVLGSVEPVSEAEQPYSSCTDGRLPIRLASGEPVPVREQIVGADMVSAFFVAEALSDKFYHHPEAPVAQRVREVANFLQQNGLRPSSHLACGAAGGFEAILKNTIAFSTQPQYVQRVQALLPEGVFDAAARQQLLERWQALLKRGAYAGLTADVFLQAARDIGGEHAIAELKDDGRGVHGHVEEFVVRLRVPGHAINTAKLAKDTNGREVFGVNDGRMDRLARLFARGNDADYKIAAMALEDFASAGHGTLAKNLPTYIITVA